MLGGIANWQVIQLARRLTIDVILEQSFGHLISEDQTCTLCSKNLTGFIKSKIWIHIGVTHDKTNDVLASKGIEPISVNIRMSNSARNKRKASDAFREEVSPRASEDVAAAGSVSPRESVPSLPGLLGQQVPGPTSHGNRTNTCSLCGQVTQNKKRLLKHYCTKHFIDRLGMMEYIFIERNRCVQ